MLSGAPPFYSKDKKEMLLFIKILFASSGYRIG
jgi:hypothetical protein